ncbi:MAG: hypothetical protein JWN52_4364 [Actinomycetia bacterium]|nr:hypothetical protein [Actinomycetes bacterium]
MTFTFAEIESLILWRTARPWKPLNLRDLRPLRDAVAQMQ